MRLLTTKRFERDFRRSRRRSKNLDKRWAVVDLLLREQPLAPHNRAHRLAGDWSGAWECHIEADWLLIWQRDEGSLTLVRTGTHSDLFG